MRANTIRRVMTALITLATLPLFAANETPGSHIACVIAPSRFEFSTHEEDFIGNTGNPNGQRYITSEHIQGANPGLHPTVDLLDHVRRIDGTYSTGVLLHTSHGGSDESIQMESFIDDDDATAQAACAARLATYSAAGWDTSGADREVECSQASDGHYSIYMFKRAITNDRDDGMNEDEDHPLVYLSTCYGSLMTDGYTDHGARVAVGHIACVGTGAAANAVTTFFERMNGLHGQDKRPVSAARAGLNLGTSGDPATTLAPSVLSVTAPCPIKVGDFVTYTLDTTCEMGIPADIVGLGCTIENEVWLTNTTLRGTCTSPVPPGAYIYGLLLKWDDCYSDNNTARLDGNTKPLINARGPAHDDYLSLHSCILSFLNDFCTQALDAFLGFTAFDTTQATPSGVHPGCGDADSPRDAWYRFVVPESGLLVANTLHSDFDTRLAIWSPDCAALTLLACNDDAEGTPMSRVELPVEAGDEVLIQIGGEGSETGIGILGLEIQPSPLPPITDITSDTDFASGIVFVTWQNGTLYDVIDVLVDGTVVATLPGLETTTTLTLDSLVRYELCLAPQSVSGPVAESCVSLFVGGDATGLDVIVDADPGGGLIDSASELVWAMNALGIDSVVADSVTQVVGTPTRVWFLAGTYPNNRALGADEGSLLVEMLASGTAVYIEGGDVWGFDPPTVFSEYDGVDQAATQDGDDTFHGMLGADFDALLLADMSAEYQQDQTGSDWTDRIPATPFDLAGANAGEVWRDDGAGGSTEGYSTGVYYATDPPFGNVIGQSWEFGGYGGDRVFLLGRYVQALTPAADVDTFKRGDANVDGGVNIADAILVLNGLFTFGVTLPCRDAADSNDDGNIDISDAITTLAFLFAGGPPLAEPGPFNCGVDPTSDGLDCAQALQCP